MSTRFAVLVCALALLVSCVPPEEGNDRIKRYDPEENIMGVIQERGEIRIGVPSDYPPFVQVNENEFKLEGFLIDLGTLVADALGVEPRFLPFPSDELLDMVYVDPDHPEAPTDADLVFPMVPITERLVKAWSFTDPYWVGHTRVLIGASGDEESSPAYDVQLLPVAYRNPHLKIGGEAATTEGYGAAVRTGASTFATLVSQVFNEADAEGDWSEFYATWLADYFADPAPEDVPIMTVEDAAALYPTDLE